MGKNNRRQRAKWRAERAELPAGDGGSTSGTGIDREIEVELMSMGVGVPLSPEASLPSHGASATQSKLKLRSFIISPLNRHYRSWEIFVLILVVYSACVCPFRFGFLKESKGPLAIADNVVNGFFAVDILLTFFLAYLDKRTYLYIDNHKLIGCRYLKSRLLFDVISTIPFELARKPLPTALQQYALLLPLWRLRRGHALFARFEKDIKFDFIWVRFSKILCVSLLSVHIPACLFYSLTANEDVETTWFSQIADGKEMHLWGRYLTSLYWAVVTMSTIGYGDLHPVNAKEMAFGIVYIFYIIVVVNGYLLANIHTIVFQITDRTREYRATVRAARSFAQRNQLPVHLREKMLAYLLMKHKTESKELQHQKVIINRLPKVIQECISHQLFSSVVDEVYLFHGVSDNLLLQLVAKMKPEHFPPMEVVISQKAAPTNFYILVTGAAELIIEKDGIEKVVGQVKIADIVGEIGVLCHRPQLFTVRTKRLCQFLRLDLNAFLNLAHSNVGDGTILSCNFLQHLEKKSSDPMIGGILPEVEAMLARANMNFPTSLCFVIDRGDDALVQLLLESGSDPNEVDENGMSPLHIATNRGNQNCVVRLLQHKADPNKKDLSGSNPLHMAVRIGNTEIVKLLVQAGADIHQLDNRGETPLSLAYQNGHDDIIEIFDNIRKGKRPQVMG